MLHRPLAVAAALSLSALSFVGDAAFGQASPPAGGSKGDAWVHTTESLAASVRQGDVCVPSAVTGAKPRVGKFKDLAAQANGVRVPTVLFLHGSSGLGLKAIGEWQQWLCELGYASLAPDSFALPGRVTYTSPIDKASYERVHALRASEIAPALAALKGQSWVDPTRLILAGASEGAVPVARYPGREFEARMVFSWSCEANYFVEAPANAFESTKPVLNVISASDPYFSKSNPWLGNPQAQGHCGAALAGNPKASVLLIPDAPHTLLNLPAARHATAGFLSSL